MGTSSDYSGLTGGGWTGYKRAATSYVKKGGRSRADRLLARYVAAAGGASAAAGGGGGGGGGARPGISAGQAVGALGAGIASGGLTPTLQALGLGHLVGRSRFEVINGLLDALAGDAATLEDQAANAAVCDAFEDIFPEDAESYGELEAIEMDSSDVVALVEKFAASWAYRRLLPTLGEKYSRLEDQSVMRQRDQELRDRLRLLVKLELEGRDPLALDWRGDEGEALISGLVRETYEEMEELDS